MEAKAVAKTIRITPRKARLVADLVRGKKAVEAVAVLKITNKGAAPVLEKVIKSAMANAEKNKNMNPSDLYIKEIYVNDGQRLKRFLPRAKGSASGLVKRTCHLYVTLSDEV